MGKGKIVNLGSFEQVMLLAVLRLGSSAYGMTIREEIERRTGKTVTLGAIYTALERLEAKGFVTSTLGEATPVRGGRPKRYFRIEGAGLGALNESRATLDQMWLGFNIGLNGGVR